jgi:YjbE family integral membrane protein
MFGPEVVAFIQVILLDLVLSGDNAVIIGALAASLPAEQRNKAIFWGMALAVGLRIAMSVGVTFILKIPFILPIGGLLLFWVAWKMYRDMTDNAHLDGSSEHGGKEAKTLGSALFAIALADVSMSLDNVLAVAGAAREHLWVMICGLFLSVVLMGFGAKLVSSWIERYKWIAWVGLILIIFVGGKMIFEGLHPMFVAHPAVA